MGGGILAHMGIAKVYSFHIVLSYSRDPFCCFTTSQVRPVLGLSPAERSSTSAGVQLDRPRRRTKTVWCGGTSRRARRCRCIPKAVAFIAYDFTIDVRPAMTRKGRVERQVTIVRDHVLAGRSFTSHGRAGHSVPVVGAAAPPHRAPHPRRGDRGRGPPRPRRAAMTPARPYLVSDRHHGVSKDLPGRLRRPTSTPSPPPVFPRQLSGGAGVGGHPSRPARHRPRRERDHPAGQHPRAVGRSARSSTPTTGTGCPTGCPSHHHRWRPRRWRRGVRRMRRRPGPAERCASLLARAGLPPRSRSTGDPRCRSMTQITGTGPFT